MMEVGFVVGIIGLALLIVLALGLWKRNVKKVLDGLAYLSLIYSSLELFRYILAYINAYHIEFPSLFHIELLVVGFAPAISSSVHA